MSFPPSTCCYSVSSDRPALLFSHVFLILTRRLMIVLFSFDPYLALIHFVSRAYNFLLSVLFLIVLLITLSSKPINFNFNSTQLISSPKSNWGDESTGPNWRTKANPFLALWHIGVQCPRLRDCPPNFAVAFKASLLGQLFISPTTSISRDYQPSGRVY